MSTIRRQTNKMKLMFAAASIVLIRRTAYVLALATLPFAFASGGGSAQAGLDSTEFSDMNDHWAKVPVQEAVTEGIVSGYDDGTFRPDRRVNRGEFIDMLIAALHIPLAASSSDRSSNEARLQSLRDIGLLEDKDAPADELGQELQRSEMIRLALRAVDPEAGKAQPSEQKEQAIAAGLIEEEGEESNDSRTVTRAEAVVVLQRLKQLVQVR
ncbi:S-layer homology domain-containing protein [Paenibacillus sp. OAS669]|uniref:S-layer homology domain-containing protein n=1 Tax=Paenibacillus sp. OAS669 TaxID=2663821 RepID=UPI00178930FC|nr:S-layer homology domain-containing protein [Paenibacillus sp. OAS669]MBE1446625.1 hypothetical protein [Paenibacillus sp. OAS669]